MNYCDFNTGYLQFHPVRAVPEERTAEVFGTNETKEVDTAIIETEKDVIHDDDRLLSVWFGGTRSSKKGKVFP